MGWRLKVRLATSRCGSELTCSEPVLELRRRVTIVQETLPGYRIALFDRLRGRLRAEGVELRLLHGRANRPRERRLQAETLEWATSVHNVNLRLPGVKASLLYQRGVLSSLGSDLVIVEQANRMLGNYLLLAAARVRGRPLVAYWGHGRNHQADGRSRRERFKRRMLGKSDWWFTYTAGVERYLSAQGYPPSRVTVVQNALDTAGWADFLSAERAATAPSGFDCLFLGGLHEHKRLEFLFEAADVIARLEPRFRLRVAGDGELRDFVVRKARSRAYVQYLGPLAGEDKLRVLAASSFILMPGMVGLVALDSIAAGVPIVTTRGPWHSPEFEYLELAEVAVILPQDADATSYATTVVELLRSPERRRDLVSAAGPLAERLTLDEMVERFAAGIIECLSTLDVQTR
jgi:glycosyltransferase involved in cell wall biosynthesis